MSDPAGQSSPGRLDALFGAQVSSRSLALLRVLIVTTLLFKLVSPWVSHRMDDDPGVLLASWAMFVSAFFVLLGYKTRITSVILALSFGTLHLYSSCCSR